MSRQTCVSFEKLKIVSRGEIPTVRSPRVTASVSTGRHLRGTHSSADAFTQPSLHSMMRLPSYP